MKTRLHANSSAPTCVNFTKVPDRSSVNQPRAIARSRPALYSAGVPLSSDKNGQLISSIKMRPSCRLDRVGDFDQLAGGGFGIGIGARLGKFHWGAITPLVQF
jgi:hypothetical protein